MYYVLPGAEWGLEVANDMIKIVILNTILLACD